MKQCEREKISFEVLCYDDGSDPKYKAKNNSLASAFGVNYLELSENLGRAKIRNWLVKSARYDHLLFLDCDSKVVRRDFIKKYLENKDRSPVISGGRVYSKKPPRAKSKLLHWKYGTKRESRKASVRNKKPIDYFHSNNFMAYKEAVNKVKFDESIKGYGYEDLFFAKALIENDFPILHIDNPVEHLGLEKAKAFLDKNLNAVSNLAKNGQNIDIRLKQIADKLAKFNLDGFLHNYVAKHEAKMMENLLSQRPKLYYFDLFRLFHYRKIKNKL